MDSALIFLEIALINVLLSGDNAIVIAMASRQLPAKQRKAAKCKETPGEAAERRIAELMALLKAAGKGAVTFFTMGAM